MTLDGYPAKLNEGSPRRAEDEMREGIGRATIPVLLLLVAAISTGCAGQSSAPTDQTAQNALWLRITRCIRDNGMPSWPDPVANASGQLSFPADAPRTTTQVQTACRSLFAELPPASQDTGHPISPSDLAKLTAFARCLRIHGFPSWPDPDQTGSFDGIPNVPSVKTVLTHPPAACRSFVPQEGIHVSFAQAQ
jgi:hypothetical protein